GHVRGDPLRSFRCLRRCALSIYTSDAKGSQAISARAGHSRTASARTGAGLNNVVAIVQARMSSERLPGKVLMPLGAKPVLVHVIERLRHARRVSGIVVASSDGADDDRIAEVAHAHECQVYRGSLEDVLGRYAGAAKAANADIVVRITADCPLVCGVVVDG